MTGARRAITAMPAVLATAMAVAVPSHAQPAHSPAPGADAAADVRTDGLQLAEVLDSSRRFAPAILEAIAKTRAADGAALASQGAFDLLFSAEGNQRLSGFYDGTYLQGKVIQPLTGNGGEIEASYRISRGDFPIYEDLSFTDRLGELKVRGVFALFRDRLIDERRFGRRNALIARDIARLDALLVAIGVQQRAIQTYGQWVAAGQQVAVYRDLLRLAEDRQAGIARQVRLGARAEILLTENEQNILRRRALLIAAERDLDNAAQRLSLFWRDAEGRPRIATRQELPGTLSRLPVARSAGLDEVLERRPDIRLIEERLEQGVARLELERNRLLPSLRLFGEVSNDFGDQGLGGLSREGLETIVGFTFSMPLQNRAATGQVAQAEATITALELQRRQVEEQIGAEVAQLTNTLETAERLATLAREEVVQAERLAAGERRLFESGASDYFLVNLREDAAANAAIRSLDAQFRLVTAQADLVAVTSDLRTLQLEDARF